MPRRRHQTARISLLHRQRQRQGQVLHRVRVDGLTQGRDLIDDISHCSRIIIAVPEAAAALAAAVAGRLVVAITAAVAALAIVIRGSFTAVLCLAVHGTDVAVSLAGARGWRRCRLTRGAVDVRVRQQPLANPVVFLCRCARWNAAADDTKGGQEASARQEEGAAVLSIGPMCCWNESKIAFTKYKLGTLGICQQNKSSRGRQPGEGDGATRA